jgi:hypothetical protein
VAHCRGNQRFEFNTDIFNRPRRAPRVVLALRMDTLEQECLDLEGQLMVATNEQAFWKERRDAPMHARQDAANKAPLSMHSRGPKATFPN